MADELPIYITPEGHLKLRDELAWLWKEERPRVTREVEQAAAHGDRSENAEYIYGKRRLREIDSRIRFLSKRLERLQVIDAEQQHRPDGRVGFGSWVDVDDEDGQTHRFRLVGPDESDADHGCISVASPIGRALIGKGVDDEVEVRRPKGTVVFTITAIHYEHPKPP